ADGDRTGDRVGAVLATADREHDAIDRCVRRDVHRDARGVRTTAWARRHQFGDADAASDANANREQRLQRAPGGSGTTGAQTRRAAHADRHVRRRRRAQGADGKLVSLLEQRPDMRKLSLDPALGADVLHHLVVEILVLYARDVYLSTCMFTPVER